MRTVTYVSLVTAKLHFGSGSAQNPTVDRCHPFAVATTVRCLFQNASGTDIPVCAVSLVFPKWTVCQATELHLHLVLDCTTHIGSAGQEVWWTG